MGCPFFCPKGRKETEMKQKLRNNVGYDKEKTYARTERTMALSGLRLDGSGG